MNDELEIVLEQPERHWRPGDTMRGHVAVEVDGRQACRALYVELERVSESEFLNPRDISRVMRRMLFQGT